MGSTVLGAADHSVRVAGSLTVDGDTAFNGSVTGIGRSGLAQDVLQPYPFGPEGWKVHDSMDTPLPATPLTDDLGLVSGAFGSATPTLQTEDLKAAGATSNYARRTFTLPPEYDAGQTITIRVHAGMLTTVADTTAVIDVEVYKSDGEGGVDGGDICATAAQSINSLSLADKDFTITPAGLSPGDELDIRITTTVTDASTGTAVKAIVSTVKRLLDIKG